MTNATKQQTIIPMAEGEPLKVVDVSFWVGGDVKRYHLSNGMFIDRTSIRAYQHYGYKYSAWLPGASPQGFAAFVGGANTLKAVLALPSLRRKWADQ